MEPKYVSVKELADKILNQSGGEIKPTPFEWYISHPPGYWTGEPPIITEDIECEIVEPKQLPPI